MRTIPTTRPLFPIGLSFLSIGLLGFAIVPVRGQRPAIPSNDQGKRPEALQEAIWTEERDTPDKGLAAMREPVDHYKTYATAWYYYGVALSRNGDFEGATKAFKQALNLNSNFIQARFRLARTFLLANQIAEAEKEGRRALGAEAKAADAHYVFGEIYLLCGDAQGALGEANTLLQNNNASAPAFLLKNQARLLTLTSGNFWLPANRAQLLQIFKDALESLEKYFALAQPKSNDGFLREQLESLRFYAKELDGDSLRPDRQLFFLNEATTKARVFSRTEAKYTEAARSVNLQGGVTLCMVLAAAGQIEHILVLRSLPFGLTGASIEAAKQAKFTPATKDGRTVSTLTQIEFNFNLY
jgi:tetratricopeptide (TPR) repeat protein